MSRTVRMVAFLAGTALVFICFGLATGEVFPEATPSVVVLTSLVTMTFIAFFVEHYFETPSTVMATAVSAVLLLVSARQDLSELGVILWILVIWCLVLLGLASVALIVLPAASAKGRTAERARGISGRLKRLATNYGNARLVFGLIAIVVAIVYLSDQPGLVVLALAYTLFLLGLETHRRWVRRKPEQDVIGVVVDVEPGEVVTVESASKIRFVPGDRVAYALEGDSEGTAHLGLISTVYRTLDGEHAVVIGSPPRPWVARVRPTDVVRVELADDAEQVGIVADGSSITSIRVDTLGLAHLSEGSLLSVEQTQRDERVEVLYQIVDASIETQGSRAATVAKAVQLGVWDEALCGFRRHGWVPQRNSAARRSEGLCCTVPTPDSIVLGQLPGTEYPVIIERESLRGGHLAVLGVTGCGKSVTARYLLNQLAADANHRIVVIDLTGEYRKRLVDPKPSPVVTADHARVLQQAVRDLMTELSKFANQRNQDQIREWQKTLDVGFRSSLEAWLDSGENSYALLELPGFESTAYSLEYTRWFLRSLFAIARSDGLEGKYVTVVLEEAHTVIPEWNFAGSKGDKAAEGLLNSIAQIALQGRKYGIGFMVIAQRTANVSKTVLTQCSSVIAFRSYDNTSAEFLSNYVGDDLSKALSNLADREAVVVGNAFRSQVPLICRVLDVDEPDGSEPVTMTGDV